MSNNGLEKVASKEEFPELKEQQFESAEVKNQWEASDVNKAELMLQVLAAQKAKHDAVEKIEDEVPSVHEPYNFESKIEFHSDEMEQMRQRDVTLAAMKYSKHEFVKMNEVGKLIQEAIQGVLDKIHQKDKVNVANKNLLRTLDSKQKNMEAQVHSLLKLTQHVSEQHKKIKKIEGDVERVDQCRLIDNQNHEIATNHLQNQLYEIDKRVYQNTDQIEQIYKKLTHQDISISDINNHCQQMIQKTRYDLAQEMDKLNESIERAHNTADSFMIQFEKLKEQLKTIQKSQIDQIVETLKIDSVKISSLDMKVRQIDNIEKKINVINVAVSSIQTQVKDTHECLMFSERALPILIHLQLCEGINSVVQTDQQMQNLHNFDLQKLAQLQLYVKQCETEKPTLPQFKSVLLNYLKSLNETGEGSAPFHLGKDLHYWPNMPNKKVDFKQENLRVWNERNVKHKQTTSKFMDTFDEKINTICKKQLEQLEMKLNDERLKKEEMEAMNSPISAERKKTFYEKPSQPPATQKKSLGTAVVLTKLGAVKQLAGTGKQEQQKEQHKEQTPVQTGPSIYNVRYIQKIDKNRLRMLESRHKQLVGRLQEEYIQRESEMNELIGAISLDQEELRNQLGQLEEMIRVLKRFTVDEKVDKEKFNAQMFAIERNYKSTIKATESNLQAQLSNIKSKLQNSISAKFTQKTQIASIEKSVDKPDKSSTPTKVFEKKQPVENERTHFQVGILASTSSIPHDELRQIHHNEQNKSIVSQVELDQRFDLKMQEIKSQTDFFNHKLENLENSILMNIESADKNFKEAQIKLEYQVDEKIRVELEAVKKSNSELVEKVKVQTAEIKSTVLLKQISLEETFQRILAQVDDNTEITNELKTLFSRDYAEFIRDRRRWKSDFDRASQNQVDNINHIEQLLNGSLSQMQVNSEAIKMILDAMMINQICELQDVEDRKKIGLFGQLNNRQVYNNALNEKLISEFEYRGSNETDDSPQNQFESNCRDHQVLKVDRQCLQCSGNMSQVIHQLKLACLSYTSTPITYRDKKYDVSDLLKVKSQVIADCQRLLRQKIYKPNADGEEILKHNDERSYVIEPLLSVKTTKSPRQHVQTVVPSVGGNNVNFLDVEIKNQLVPKNNEIILNVKACNPKERTKSSGRIRGYVVKNTNSRPLSQQSITLLQTEEVYRKSSGQPQKFEAFSPISNSNLMNQTQSSTATAVAETRRKLKIGQKAGQVLDGSAFNFNTLSEYSFNSPTHQHRPSTQSGVSRQLYNGSSQHLGARNRGLVQVLSQQI